MPPAQKLWNDLETLKARIAALDLIATGTLLHRTKVCGKPNCRCAVDTAARHGPYFEWNRWQERKLRHLTLSAREAEQLEAALANYQEILGYLEQWEFLSARILLGDRIHWPKTRHK